MPCRKVLIIGATGMLGHTLLQRLSEREDMEVFATVRNREGLDRYFTSNLLEKIHHGVDANDLDSVLSVITDVKPDVVINCVGIIKQLPTAKDPIISITINALFPHHLALICKNAGARLIHFSTDCVFNGVKGNYTEDDPSDANDLYGRTKFLGELSFPHCVTLRTSIIGHELNGRLGLIDWFLSQEGKMRGFTQAIYTGFPTVEMARIIAEYVIPNENLSGLYQVSSSPISKYELLRLVADQYNKRIEIEPYAEFSCDRSLDSRRFCAETGYRPPSWQELVTLMHDDFMKIEEEINHGNI